MADRPTAGDVKAHLAEARRRADLAMAAIRGATGGTATADRWDMAAVDLRAATEALAAASQALAAMEKREPYCTVCGEAVLSLTAGWTHVSSVEQRQAGHEPELDWREVPQCRA